MPDAGKNPEPRTQNPEPRTQNTNLSEYIMNWFFTTIRSSIGKKLMMAITGLGFCTFLLGHLAGNLTIYGGEDALNSYAEHLHSLGPLINAAEIGLLTFAIIHVLTGITLFYQNFRARPVRYAVNKAAGGRTIASWTMPYSGFIVLIFIVTHLLNFHFVDKTERLIFQIVSEAFLNPVYVIGYVLAMIVMGLHVRHGFWSAFQTIGANHPKYMPAIRTGSILFGLLVGFGFGLIPIYFVIV
jgi:succinate dehydrogenase / fumarate reductase cytochrome b subunit